MILQIDRIYFIRNILLYLIFIFAHEINSQPSNSSNHDSNKNRSSENQSLVETRFERISTEQGLSSDVVVYIDQDKDGFIWICTDNGLNKYNGKSFKNFHRNPNDNFSISSDTVVTTYVDNEGILWILNGSGGLIKYDSELDRFTNYDSLENEGYVYSLIDDNQGNLVIGSLNGLILFNKKTGVSKLIPESYNLVGDKNPVQVRSLSRNKSNQIWAGTYSSGLYLLDSNYKILKHYLHDSTDNSSLSSNRITCIFIDTKKNVWIGTRNGLNLYNEIDDNFTIYKNDTINLNSISSNVVTAVCEDKSNCIWVGTWRGGLNKLISPGIFINFKNNEADIYSLSNDVVMSLFVDRSNVLWIGTWGGGINKLDCQQKKFNLVSKIFKTENNSFPHSLSSIYIDSLGSYWVAVRFNDGIYKLGKNHNGDLYYKGYDFISKHTSESSITSIIEIQKSNLLLASFYGDLVEYNREIKVVKKLLKNKNYRIKTVCRKENFLYIGTVNFGLLKFDVNKMEFVTLDSTLNVLTNKIIIYLLPDKKNNLWICTELDGLYRYEFDNGSLTNFRYESDNKNSLSDNHIVSIYEDIKGNMWICTNSKGLNKFNMAEKNFIRYGAEVGLPSYLSGIQEDESGKLWFTSLEGLYKFEPEKKIAQKYGKSDGVERFDIIENVSSKDKDGVLYFGGLKGLTYFTPSEIKDNPYIPNVVLTDFQIFNESVKPSLENPYLKKSITAAKEIDLSYKESVFSFDFAALIFNNPSKNQYAYMMEGFDKGWVYCGTRRNVTYTNLDPGDYTFKVKGSNNDGIWNEEGTSVKITITPPWWQTWWFKSCGAAMIFMTVGYGFKKRINKIKKEKTAQEEFSRRLIESQEEERKRIASALHDTIAHDILLTKSKALLALRNPDDTENLKNALNEISDMSSETINDVRGISYNLHPHQLERLGFSEAIESIIKDVSRASDIEFSVKVDNVDDVISKEAEINLYRVIQEGINNIIKHSKATEAELKVIRLENQIIITISDNGIGLASDKNSSEIRKHGFGLSGIAERVKILKGEFKVESEGNSGTVLRISIPFSNFPLAPTASGG